MRSWPAPAVPRLTDQGLPATAERGFRLHLHDTLSGAVRPTDPGATARMYVCGITPYDATHLGHAATYLAFDLVNRVWRDLGHDVHYVQNVTDVDEPLLERAEETGDDWRVLAERETELFRADMAALRVLPPRDYVGAVEAIPQVVALIQRLRDTGATYEVDDDVYFSVRSDPGFGEISGLGRAEMARLFGQNGGDPERPGKKDPLDCLLWRAARPGEPAWESDLGRGRPGWHIECAAISIDLLGMGIDVEGGGSDLIFPHHEMSAAEAQVATAERPHARAYVHTGMVGLDGRKMSKSRGNLVFVSRLRASTADPAAIRLALLAHHYRTDWEWTPGDLERSTARLRRWREAARAAAGPPAGPVLEEIRRALTADLDAPAAIAAVDGWAEAVEGGDTGGGTGAPGQVRTIVDALLGIDLAESAESGR
jgi:L-cysteine:1D-myo-inositol 2-amino-2-deoxy-alpha-D-glucopyranoside ligase